MRRFIGEPDDTKPNNVEAEEEHLSIDDDDIESNKEANTTMKSKYSSNKAQLSNFSVLSLLSRKSPDKEEEKQSPAEYYSQKQFHFPSNGDDVAEEGDEVDKVDKPEQCRKVGNGKL